MRAHGERGRDLTDPEAIGVALARGRWFLKEMQAAVALRKYRALKQRYSNDDAAPLDHHKD